MSIDVSDKTDRARLARSMAHWYKEQEQYRAARRESVMIYAGSPQFASSLGVEVGGKRMWGNLHQLSAIAHTISLAYNDPMFNVVPNVPEADAVSPRLEEFLNRYSPLIGLGDIARAVALDSFFGYGIAWVDLGMLPPGVQHLTKQKFGPMCWRVSQDNFGFDGSATSWDQVSFIYKLELVPLKQARAFEPFLAYNPEGVQALKEFGSSQTMTDSQLHTQNQPFTSPQAMTRLATVYLPHSGVISTWPADQVTFQGIADKPLWVRPHTGHHTGPASVLSHIDVPDNLIPVAQSESNKALHYLFQELMDITANQAKKAKVNPVYEIGSQKDMERLEQADDRAPVGVSNISKIGRYEIPPPTQGQTAIMSAAMQLYKEFAGNMDDTLGLGPTASTARQSELIRSSTTATSADRRRRMDRMMESVARKLAHLSLADPTLSMPIRKRVPGTTLQIDMSWQPPELLSRNPDADDHLITIVGGSMEYRDAQTRLTQLKEATGEIMQVAMAAAQGIPLNLEAFVETQAKYRNLPELREWFIGLLPEHQQAKEAAGMRMADPNKPGGNYTRTNVSERSNDGALTQNLTQATGGEGGDGSGAAVRLVG